MFHQLTTYRKSGRLFILRVIAILQQLLSIVPLEVARRSCPLGSKCHVLVSPTGHVSWTGPSELDGGIVEDYARHMIGVLTIVLIAVALWTGDRVVKSLNIPRE